MKLAIDQILVDLDGTLLGNRALPLGVEFVARSLRMLSPLGGLRKAARGLLAIGRELSASGKVVSAEARGTDANDIRVVQRFAQAMGLTLEEAREKLRQGLLDIFPTLQRHFYPMPGARDFLEWARERYPLVLATNPVWPPEIIEMRVRWAGIDPTVFRSITHIRTMSASKPSLEYYRQILSREAFKAERTLLVGNDAKMDLPATQVGVTVFLVDSVARAAAAEIPGTQGLGWRGNFAQLRSLLGD